MSRLPTETEKRVALEDRVKKLEYEVAQLKKLIGKPVPIPREYIDAIGKPFPPHQV